MGEGGRRPDEGSRAYRPARGRARARRLSPDLPEPDDQDDAGVDREMGEKGIAEAAAMRDDRPDRRVEIAVPPRREIASDVAGDGVRDRDAMGEQRPMPGGERAVADGEENPLGAAEIRVRQAAEPRRRECRRHEHRPQRGDPARMLSEVTDRIVQGDRRVRRPQPILFIHGRALQRSAPVATLRALPKGAIPLATWPPAEQPGTASTCARRSGCDPRKRCGACRGWPWLRRARQEGRERISIGK
jgi:hypothetical protein